MRLHTGSSDETVELGERLGLFLKPGDIIALKGTLAAGKTTLTKGLARALDIAEEVTSPTFTLISEYEGRLPLYHMDMYRIDSSEDFYALGGEDFLYGEGVCVIEWSEKIMDALPERTISISLSPSPDGGRDIEIENWPYGDVLSV